VVTRGKLHNTISLEGFVAECNGSNVGIVTYRLDGGECELVTLDSQDEGMGVGSELIDAVKNVARSAGCNRVWLVTTNDNVPAQKFYQNRGFKIKAVHKDAIAESRKLKPEIPMTGIDGVPITDEIEMEMML